MNVLGETATSQLIRDFIPGQTTAPVTRVTETPTPIVQKTQKKALSKMLEAPLDEDLALQWIQDPTIDINAADYMRWTALHKVAAWEKTRVLMALLDHPDIQIDRPGMDGDTPLHAALSNGATRCAAILIDDERTSKIKTNDLGITPLMLAASLGDRRTFERLLPFGMIDQRSLKGKTAWNFAKDNGHDEIASMLPEGEMIETKPRPTRVAGRLNDRLIAIQEALKKTEQ